MRGDTGVVFERSRAAEDHLRKRAFLLAALRAAFRYTRDAGTRSLMEA
jgi:hypothetical protein